MKWHGISLGFAGEVVMGRVCQILTNPTPSTEKEKADRRRLWLIPCALLSIVVAACAPSDTYELTDLTGPYGEFFDRTQGLAADARVAAFKAEMGARLPGFYDAARLSGTTSEQYDLDIARSFSDFPQRREALLRTAASFQSMLPPAVESFVGVFGDARGLGRIALLHSVGEMDAGTRILNGRRYLVFGADVMARLHAPGSERPFFHHELFHAYHEPLFGQCEPLWCALWMEGLAVYVGGELNPGATDADLLLTSPRPIRADVDAKLARAVCAIRARLDSTSQTDYADFFLGSSSFEDLPPRSGYYLGYLALRQLGNRQPPRDLARLDQTAARSALEAALAGLAACP